MLPSEDCYLGLLHYTRYLGLLHYTPNTTYCYITQLDLRAITLHSKHTLLVYYPVRTDILP